MVHAWEGINDALTVVFMPVASHHDAMTDQPRPVKPGQLRERTAEEIRALLGRRRISGAELARRTGMKQPYLSRRMTGELAFDLDDLEVIARELGVSVLDLLGGKGVQPTVPDVAVAERLILDQLKLRPAVPMRIPGMRRPARVETDPLPAHQSFGSHDLVA